MTCKCPNEAGNASSDPKESREFKKAAKRFKVNWKRIAKWRNPNFVNDLAMGPKVVCSTVLSEAEEAVMVAFRKKTPLPLADVLTSLKETIPHLTRSSLHRCFVGQDVQRREQPMTQQPKKKPFNNYPRGYFHIDIAEVRTAAGRLYLFVEIDRTSELTYAERHPSATRTIAGDSLTHLIAAVPHQIHTV